MGTKEVKPTPAEIESCFTTSATLAQRLSNVLPAEPQPESVAAVHLLYGFLLKETFGKWAFDMLTQLSDTITEESQRRSRQIESLHHSLIGSMPRLVKDSMTGDEL